MRTPLRSLFCCWLFVVVAASTFGQYTAQYWAGNSQGDTIQITQVLTAATAAPNGTYGVSFSGTCAGTPSGCVQNFGTITCNATVSGGTATLTGCHFDGSGGNILKSGNVTSFMPCNSGGQLTFTMAKSGTWPGGSSFALSQDGPVTVTRHDNVGSGTATTVVAPFHWSIGAAVSGSASFLGALQVGKNAKAHTLSLKYNGTQVATITSAVNSATPVNLQFPGGQYLQSVAYTGDTYEWLVDGVSQGGVQTVTLSNIGTVEAPIWSFTSTFASQIPGGDAPTPTPAATPTPTAFPTATPQTGSTPNIITYSRGGGSGNSTAVTVVNPQDIYNPIVADIDKTNTLLSQAAAAASPSNADVVAKLDEMEHSGTSAPGSATDTHESADFTGRGHLDDLQSSVDAGVTARNDVITNLTASANAFISDASALSGASFGNTLVIPMPFSFIGHAPAVGKIDLPDTIDLSDWSGLIAMLREVLLWLLRIAFWVLVYKLFAAHGIQAT